MSTNHRRRTYSAHYSAGTSALAAPALRPGRLQPTRGEGRVRDTGGPQFASAPSAVLGTPVLMASALTASPRATSVPLPADVVALFPGSTGSCAVGGVTAPGAAASPATPRRSVRLMCSEAGMATAEYAIATLAAVGFAGLLVFILRSDEVRGFLLNLIRTALALP